jgi:hypothetical protein
MVTKVVVDDAYLRDYEFADLGGFVTGAAQAAAREIGRRATELMLPMSERRQAISQRSGMLVDAPDFSDVMAAMNVSGDFSDAPPAGEDSDSDFEDQPSPYPIVRKTDV